MSARQALGRALGQLRSWRAAIEQYAIVVDVEPANAWAHNNLGHAALQLGDDALALAHLEIAARVGGQPVMFNNLGVAFERVGRTAEAHAAFARALELSPTYAVATMNRARVQRLLDHGARLAAAEALLALRTTSASSSLSSSSSSSSSDGPLTGVAGAAHAE